MSSINFKKIERKWQKKWEEKKIFEVKENKKKKKFFVLEMYPYPSGSGLHMGHAFNYTIGDIYARFKRMSGFNVLYPMGYDSFGLPAENAAIKAKMHPRRYTEKSIKNFLMQQKQLGLSYDWSRILWSHSPEYYKWNQFFFLKFLEKGLIYRKKSPVNWCRKCGTVLANEQVHKGKCWRHEDTDVETKQLEQWFIKTTKYAEELLQDIEKLQWPERIKIMQRNWIGRSEGTEIDFEIENPDKEISNVIIVHGSNQKEKEKLKGGSPPQNKRNWLPWIKKKLGKKGIKCETPLMPASWAPKYKDWKKELEKLKIGENSVLIGHSAGGAFLVRWLGETKKKIKKLILVSPGKAEGWHMRYLDNLYGSKTYKDIQEFVNEKIILFTAKDDYPHHITNAYNYEKELPAKVVCFEKGFGHFVEKSMGTKEFPELFEKIISKQKWPIFTTRPDTIFGVTFMVISAQHPKLFELVTNKQKKEVEKFLKKIKSVSEEELGKLEKEGVFTGIYAINPINKEKIPVYVGNFVIADYGSGMVMAVPAHDQRDFEFAKKYGIKIKQVIKGGNVKKEAYTGDGFLINSGRFNGLENHKAKWNITQHLEGEDLGRKSVQYKLRDWLVSRQRYWGTPIPIVYCDKCGVVPVPEKDLPVKLPEKVKFGKGNPLETAKTWISVKCPKCWKKARRETDTMDTFFDSSWYYLRYCDSKNKKESFNKKKIDYWMPVNQYVGGAEHACMHLIYARFFTKALRDLGFLDFDEPFTKLFNQGMLHGEDGMVMSKSRGNVVLPEEVSKEYGIDAARLFLVSIASPDKDIEWSDAGIEGSFRFVKKVMDYFEKIKFGKTDKKIQSKLHKSIKEVTLDIENFRYNLAVIKIRKLFDGFKSEISKETAESFLKLLHPFCPHITEELWQKIDNKNFVSLESWPEFEKSKIDEKLEKEEEIINNVINDINNIIKIVRDKGKKINKIYLYSVPSEKEIYVDYFREIERRTGFQVGIYAVNDKGKHDPKNKSRKVKPGKPGIYLE